jgi:protein-S-isoprenylcysteine O-methyltransferase Ste14
MYGILWIYFLFNVIMSELYVLSEEKANVEKFGEEYTEYMKRTPRWVGVPKSKGE